MLERAQHTSPKLSDYFPTLGRNGKALGSVMQNCGSPARDHLLWWLLDPHLGKVYLRWLLRDPAPIEILIAFENHGFC